MKTYTKVIYLFVLYFAFVVSGYASHDMLLEDDMMQTYCDFNGILKDKKRWSVEFKMLEEPNDHPNFRFMSDILSVFVRMPKDMIKNCPNLNEYLKELVSYNTNTGNTEKKKEVSRAIDYISKKLQNDPKSDTIE